MAEPTHYLFPDWGVPFQPSETPDPDCYHAVALHCLDTERCRYCLILYVASSHTTYVWILQPDVQPTLVENNLRLPVGQNTRQAIYELYRTGSNDHRMFKIAEVGDNGIRDLRRDTISRPINNVHERTLLNNVVSQKKDSIVDRAPGGVVNKVTIYVATSVNDRDGNAYQYFLTVVPNPQNDPPVYVQARVLVSLPAHAPIPHAPEKLATESGRSGVRQWFMNGVVNVEGPLGTANRK